ncbi:hypothetical protein BGZ58_003121, partial [Dissophora ornata]
MRTPFGKARALEIANQKLLVGSSIVAKETAVKAQTASIKEVDSEFRRYPLVLKTIDETNTET